METHEARPKRFAGAIGERAVREKDRALISQIEAAFAGVTLGGDAGIHETLARKRLASAQECAEARKKDRLRDWRAIPASDLEACAWAIYGFGPEALRFHAPRLMTAQLAGELHANGCARDILAFCLTRRSLEEKGAALFRLFTQEQKCATAAFLRAALSIPENEAEEEPKLPEAGQRPRYLYDWAAAKEALALFWAQPRLRA